MKNRNQYDANDANSDYFSDFGRNQRSGNGMSGTSKTLVAIAAGAAAGAVTAMLLTPKSGAENRRALSRGASKVGETLKQGIDYINDKVEDLRGTAENLKDEATDTFKQGLKNTTSGTSNFSTRGTENYSDQSQQGYGKSGSKSTGSKTGNL